jgi:hypothetical protein
MSGIAVSQLDDMYNSASRVFLYARASTYYDNKIYLKAETPVMDMGLQSLNIKTGSWCNLTTYASGKAIYGFETIVNKLYEIASLRSGSATTIDIIPYIPLTDTWGTKQSFTHSYNQDTRSCSYGNDIYIAYEYANISGSYTWHLKKFDTSASTVSDDLNFEVTSKSGYSLYCNLESTNDSIFFINGTSVYKYNPAINSTGVVTAWTFQSILEYDLLSNINNDLYHMSCTRSASLIYLSKLNVSASSTSASNININKLMFLCSSDKIKNLYIFGEAGSPYYPYGTTRGTTYCVTVK